MSLLSLFLLWLQLPLAGDPQRPVRPAPEPAAAAAVKILSDTVLPAPVALRAVDVRWASDRRVYLALGIEGVIEADVDSPGSAPKERFAGRSKPDGVWAVHRLAASSRYLVAAAPAYSVSWRRLDGSDRGEAAFDAIQALDVHENRLVVVGARRDDNGNLAREGAIAWIGSLDRGLIDLKPLLYDAAGPGAPTFNHCLGMQLASVRFLPDGTVAVLPGTQPGLQVYDLQGTLLRTWDTAPLGIDTDCASLSQEQTQRFGMHGTERQGWANQRRTVDALIPLPQGLGFLIRRVEQGKARWVLKVLRQDGSIRAYAVPLEANNGFHLLADVRGDRLIFLLHEFVYADSGRTQPEPARLILAETPAP